MGYPAYPCVRDIPDPVDYVIISVPRDHILTVLKDCVSKNVPVVHIFTAGFDETHTPEGKSLKERELRMTGRFISIYQHPSLIFSPADTFKTEIQALHLTG